MTCRHGQGQIKGHILGTSVGEGQGQGQGPGQVQDQVQGQGQGKCECQSHGHCQFDCKCFELILIFTEPNQPSDQGTTYLNFTETFVIVILSFCKLN